MSFELAVRVYYEDTDAAGIVYHANYLRFAERARTEWLRVMGITHTEMRSRFGCQFAVRTCRMDFRRPARLDDLLVIHTGLLRATGARINIGHRITRAADLIATLEIELALIAASGRPVRMPGALAVMMNTVKDTDEAA